MPFKAATRFEGVDALRGICALLVAMLHCETYSHVQGARFFNNAYLFVDFFFVLSGFVIASNYAERLRDGYALGRFALLRFGRVYPLYLVTLLAFVAMEVLQLLVPALGAMGAEAPFAAPRQSWDTILANVFLLQSFGTYDFLTWNTPGWSIATEFWTYLAFALLVKYAYGARIGILAGTVVIGLAVIAAFSPRYMNTSLDYGFIRTLAGFAAGALVFEVWRWRKTVRPFADTDATAVEVLAIAGVAGFVTLADQSALSLLAPIVFAGVVLVFIAEAGAVSRVLKTRPLQVLGLLSYSIYMVHLFIGTYATNLGKLLQAKTGSPMLSEVQHGAGTIKVLGTTRLEGDLWLTAIIAAVLVCSWLTYRFIEVPARDWFRRLAQGGRMQTAGDDMAMRPAQA